MLTDWLESGMFKDSENAKEMAENVVSILNSNEITKNHSKHIGIDEAESIGLKVISVGRTSKR
jgi:hypothetical protein